jgi:hypothetical protein
MLSNCGGWKLATSARPRSTKALTGAGVFDGRSREQRTGVCTIHAWLLEAKARGKYLEGRIPEHRYQAGIGILNVDSALAFYGDKLGFV